VEFAVAPESRAAFTELFPDARDLPGAVLIWTTTPWTIPSNLAIAFHPDFSYAAYEVDGRAVVVAAELAGRVESETGRTLGRKLGTVRGERLEGVAFRHPLYNRKSVGVLGEYVTLEQGTGAVHTAPGHGADDFATGVKYGLEIYAPIGPGGHFNEDVELFGGLGVFDANPKIEDALESRGRLWKRATVQHSYPHCWRCHNPVIFLATWQWFVRMEAPLAHAPDAKTLRQYALDAIAQVQWVPSWGQERIHNMLANRPDWCISRQRSWGVPIPAVYCTRCREAILTTGLTDRAAAVFEVHGADSWYERDVSEFVPPDLSCPQCGGRSFERERDILDVWFDSGASHEGVLARRPELAWPADVYLEGTDQYRGWFHSSLLVGLGTRGDAPYRTVITHGFVVDEQGRKMSKSRGTGVEPQEVIAKSGAEVLRLWAAMVDYRDEVRLGPEILARVVEAYRKIRNTLRILAANLYDFDPALHTVPATRLEEVDRYALASYAQAALRILQAYDEYEFQAISHRVNTLLTVDLSAFYIDVSKDRLYTLAPDHPSRRSAQTAMFAIAEGLARLTAVILPVTMDELWQHLPGRRKPSVHLSQFPSRAELEPLVDAGLLAEWEWLRGVRENVNRAIEVARQQKVIGNSLGARVSLMAADDGLAARLRRQDLETVFIVSQVSVKAPESEEEAALITAGSGGLQIDVSRAEGSKCPRCWRYVAAVSAQPEYAGLCDRCVDAVTAMQARAGNEA
jgi:isoleucyl-tRNA synthetase